MKIYSDSYSNNFECAKDAKATSWQQNTIVTIACDLQSDYDEICEYLENDEDCIDYVDNDDVMEVLGVVHMSIGNADYRVHVYVIDPDKNRF